MYCSACKLTPDIASNADPFRCQFVSRQGMDCI
jgi:hypothetical protein